MNLVEMAFGGLAYGLAGLTLLRGAVRREFPRRRFGVARRRSRHRRAFRRAGGNAEMRHDA